MDKRLDVITEYGDFFYKCIQEMQLFNKSIGIANQKNIMIKNILPYVKHEHFFSHCEFDELGIKNTNFYIRYDEIDNYIHSHILNRKKEKKYMLLLILIIFIFISITYAIGLRV